MHVQNWCNSGVLLLCVFFFTASAPPTPASAPRPEGKLPEGSVGRLFGDKNFIILLIVNTLIFCSCNGFGIWLGMLIAPFAYGPVTASWCGATMVCTGGLMGNLVGWWLSGSNSHLTAIRLVCLGATLYQAFGYFVLSTETWSVYTFFFLCGALTPMGPGVGGYTAGIAGPLAPLAETIMNLVACYSMFFSLFAFTAILSPIQVTSSEHAILTYGSLAFGAFLFSLLMSEPPQKPAANDSEQEPMVANSGASFTKVNETMSTS